MNTKRIFSLFTALVMIITFFSSVPTVKAIDDKLDKNDETPISENKRDEEIEEKPKDNGVVFKESNENNIIKINSFDDLKKCLVYKSIKSLENSNEPAQRLVLNGGNYEFNSNFEIDLNDEYFDGKKDSISYGLISADEEIHINGNNHTISFKQEDAVPLFGIVISPKYEIRDLKISYPNNVSGFAFAQVLQSEDEDTGIANANGMVKNIELKVGGNVTPLKAVGKEKRSNYFIGEYNGLISSGFAWFIQNTNIENINININGNIGSEKRPEAATDMVASYGFVHHFGNVPYTNLYNAETWKELFDKGNPNVLKNTGYIIGVNLNVGGSIKAYGNNVGYSAGMGHDMGSAWMDNIHLNIKGDIITDLKGNSLNMNRSYNEPYAFGFSDELMNLTSSSLNVNNIVFNADNLPEESKLNLVGALANNNSKGNYINIKDNRIIVNGKVKGKTNKNLLASIGFNNDWNSNGDCGTNWICEVSDNIYDIGEIDLDSDGIAVFNALGKKLRTGKNSLGSYKLPEASLSNEKLSVGNMKISAKDLANVSLLMNNASNAKNNKLDYGNIIIKANKTNFYGMGNLQNDSPKENFYKNVTENNNLTIKNLNIDTKDAQYISLMVGFQDTDQEFKNNCVKAENVNIKLNSNKSSYISGIVGYSCSPVDSCRVFLDSISIEDLGTANLYFGLGAATVDSSKINESGVFVDGSININAKTLYGGGFVGFSKNSSIENSDFQLDGKNNIELKDGTYGGFAGFIRNSNLNNDSGLILNDFMPFVRFANGGSLEHCSHYVNEKAPKFFSGILTSGKNDPLIINSTLLVNKKYEDTILYRKDNVSEKSNNNYLVVVDNSQFFNRVAYATSEVMSKSAEMGEEIPVFKKSGEALGKINIKARDFQDEYWTLEPNLKAMDFGDVTFDYMTNSDAGKISAFGVDSKRIISNDCKNGHLFDYYHRHAGLVSGNGIVYDLLGIKGDTFFTVVYDGNGADIGSVPLDNNYYAKGKDVKVLSEGDLSRKGYAFAGWNTRSDGLGKKYKRGDSFIIEENTTLYAIWEKVNNKVTFKNGNEDYSIVTVEDGYSIDNDSLTDQSMPENPVKKGYTFKGWNTLKDGKGVWFTGKTVVNEDITVYAIYEKDLVKTNEAPKLKVKDATIIKGNNFDLMKMVISANDKEDGDLKRYVKVIDAGGFDNNKVGEYIVVFEVKDSDGARTVAKAKVTVKDGTLFKGSDINSSVPKTGDRSFLLVFVALLVVSGVLFIVTKFLRKNK